MFALFSLSPIEIIILGLLCLLFIGVPVVALLVVFGMRKPKPPEPPDDERRA